jgi:tetratricopeptide (TPR) repeat protein
MKKIYTVTLVLLVNLNLFGQAAQNLYERGKLKLSVDNFEGAINDLNKAIKSNPLLANAYIKKAEAQFYLSDYQKALETINKGIKIGFESDSALYLRGRFKQALNDTLGAYEDFKKVVKYNPKFKGVNKNLADLMKLRVYPYDYEDAINYYQQEIENVNREKCKLTITFGSLNYIIQLAKFNLYSRNTARH